MAEAKAEYDAWVAEPRVVMLTLPHAGATPFVWVVRPPAAACERCGQSLREYGRRRCQPCRVAVRAEGKPPCACGGPYYASGKCKPCYESDRKYRRRSERGRKQKPHDSLRRRIA